VKPADKQARDFIPFHFKVDTNSRGASGASGAPGERIRDQSFVSSPIVKWYSYLLYEKLPDKQGVKNPAQCSLICFRVAVSSSKNATP
jgi:hypothetical protein